MESVNDMLIGAMK